MAFFTRNATLTLKDTMRMPKHDELIKTDFFTRRYQGMSQNNCPIRTQNDFSQEAGASIHTVPKLEFGNELNKR